MNKVMLEDYMEGFRDMKKYGNGKIANVRKFLEDRVYYNDITQDEAKMLFEKLNQEDFFENDKKENVDNKVDNYGVKEDLEKPLLISKKLKFPSLNELPPKAFLIERLALEKGKLYNCIGTGSSGKTMFLQYLACCVSSGTPLFGEFPVSRGDVVHIDEEQSEDTTLRRYIRIASGMGIDTDSLNIERVNISKHLDSNDEIDTVEDKLTELFQGKALAIIDSLRAISCEDENDTRIRTICDKIRKAANRSGCAAILIHHKGKANANSAVVKQSNRGSSAIYDACDGQFDLDLDLVTETIEATFTKMRDCKMPQGFRYMLKDLGEYHDVQKCSEKLGFELLISSTKSKKNNRKVILEMLNSSTEQVNQSKLFEAVGGQRASFDDLVKKMVDAGELKESRGAKNARIFEITEEGKKSLEVV